MEYRRKRRVTYQRPQRGAFPAYAAVFIAFFGVAYLIGASRVGTYVAKNWIAPVLRQSDADSDLQTQQTPAPTPQTVVFAELERTLTVPARTVYAVQIGVYEEKTNAEAQSDALQQIGAAGYVLEDGGRFRVLASAYPVLNDAQAVVTQLKEAGVDSVLHVISLGEKKLTLTGTTQQLSMMEEATGGVDAMLAELYDFCIDFDKEQRSMEDGIATLVPLQKRAQNYCEMLAQLTASAGEGLAGIDAFYETVQNELAASLALQNAPVARFSALSKRSYLCALLALR